MTFVAGQVLTAAQLNALDITSLTVDTDTLVVDATNDRVGINTASPSVALDVGGSVVIDDTLAVDTDTLFTNGAGQVGIGTTTPTANHVLHTHGAVLISSTTGVGNSHFPFTDGRFYYTADPETGGTGDHVFRHYSGGSYVEQMRIYENGNVNITGALTPGQIDAFDNVSSPSSSTAKFLFGRSSSQALAFHGNASGNYITSISQTSNPKSMRIFVSKDDGATGTDFVFDTAGLGVGVTPAVPFHVLRSTGGEAVRLQTNTGSGAGPYISFRDTSTRVGYMGFPNNDDLHCKNETANGRFYVSTNNTTRMTVHQNGNVGIGTTGPSQKLHVNGGMFYSYRTGFNPGTNENAGLKVEGNYGGGIIFAEGTNRTKVHANGGNQFQVRVGAQATTAGQVAIDVASSGSIKIPGSFPGVSGYYTVRRRNSDGQLGYASSSQRYKENIVDADETWRQIYNLRPRDFDWRESFFGDDPDGVPTDRSDFGLIAEEVNEVMPSIVQWTSPPPPDPNVEATEEGEPFVPVIEAVDYEKLSTYLLPAIQDLHARVATLESA